MKCSLHTRSPGCEVCEAKQASGAVAVVVSGGALDTTVGGGLGLPSHTFRPLPTLPGSLVQAPGLSAGSSRSACSYCEVRFGWSESTGVP